MTQQYRFTLRQLIKYAPLSLFTYLIYSGLCTLALLIDLNQILAIIIAFVAATSFNFLLSKKIFVPYYLNSQNASRTLSRYISAALFNLLLVLIFNSFISRNFSAGLGSALIAPFIPTFLNFFIMKYLVFRV